MKINEITTKYFHGSRTQFPVGFMLQPQNEGYVLAAENKWVENFVEKYRPLNKLARRRCVFMVGDPAEIDYAGGYEDYIYEVKPFGNIEPSDLAWYTEVQALIGDFPDKEMTADPPEAIQAAKNYWSGVRFKNPANSLFEYRSPAARIIRLISQINEDSLSFEKTEFRDNLGVLQGTTQTIGQRIEGRDRLGRLVGYFDIKLNTTRDYNGRRIGTGNQLTSLFMTFSPKT